MLDVYWHLRKGPEDGPSRRSPGASLNALF
jgi:hypothetical protein